jgi:hypothetical protein
MGDTADFDIDPFLSLSEARGDAIPSWDADVGTLTKFIDSSHAAHFVTSMTEPPPTPSKKSEPVFFDSLITVFT